MITRKTWWVLMLFPVVFFAVNRTWMYSTSGYTDSWMYTGYFLHPELLYPRIPEAYQGVRVLHIWPGWLLNHWLPTMEAIFVHKTVLFYAIYLLLFGLLRRLFRNERAALLGAALGLANGLMLDNLSWNYVFCTIPVLLIGNLWAQVRMKEGRRWWLWAMLAGALYVGAVWTNPRSAFLAPLVFAMFVYGLPQQTWRGLGAGLAWAALGGVLGMVVQGVLSLSLGGPFWYFMAEVSEVQNYDLHDVRFEPLEHWWYRAVWITYLGLGVVPAVLAIWRGRRWVPADGRGVEGVFGRGWGAPLPFTSLVYVGGLTWFVILSVAEVDPLLQNSAQASFLFPILFVVMGGWVAWLMANLKESGQWLMVAAGLGGILLVYGWLGAHWPKGWRMEWVLLLIPVVWLAAMAGLGARRRLALAAAMVFAASVAGLNLYFAPRTFLVRQDLERAQVQNEVLYATVRRIDDWDAGGHVWFWYNVNRPNGVLHQWLSYFYEWDRDILGERFPDLAGRAVDRQSSLPPLRPFELRPGMRMVLFETTTAEIAAVQAALAPRGLKLNFLNRAQRDTISRYTPEWMELWEAVPTGQTQGRAVDISGAATAADVERVSVDQQTAWRYPAGEAGPFWGVKLPENLPVAKGAPAGLIHVRIGGNERRLRLILADDKARELEETVVDPGTEVRDWWLELQPGVDYGRLEVRPLETDAGGSFTIESVDY